MLASPYKAMGPGHREHGRDPSPAPSRDRWELLAPSRPPGSSRAQNLVQRLSARQTQLVSLQTAVLALWGRCSQDPDFASAFQGASASAAARRRPATANARSERSGAAGGGGSSLPGSASGPGGGAIAAGDGVDDPLAMLHMISEFVTAKSDGMAIKHFSE
jgi:hypothetical protein